MKLEWLVHSPFFFERGDGTALSIVSRIVEWVKQKKESLCVFQYFFFPFTENVLRINIQT